MFSSAKVFFPITAAGLPVPGRLATLDCAVRATAPAAASRPASDVARRRFRMISPIVDLLYLVYDRGRSQLSRRPRGVSIRWAPARDSATPSARPATQI